MLLIQQQGIANGRGWRFTDSVYFQWALFFHRSFTKSCVVFSTALKGRMWITILVSISITSKAHLSNNAFLVPLFPFSDCWTFSIVRYGDFGRCPICYSTVFRSGKHNDVSGAGNHIHKTRIRTRIQNKDATSHVLAMWWTGDFP